MSAYYINFLIIGSFTQGHNCITYALYISCAYYNSSQRDYEKEENKKIFWGRQEDESCIEKNKAGFSKESKENPKEIFLVQFVLVGSAYLYFQLPLS